MRNSDGIFVKKWESPWCRVRHRQKERATFLTKIAPLFSDGSDLPRLCERCGIDTVCEVCGLSCGSFSLMGIYDHHLQNEKNEPHSENEKMTVIRKISPPIHSEMIIISVILKWYNDRHLKTPCRFIFDLWRIYPFIFKWQRNLVFGMMGWCSFRYDREKPSLRIWQAHFLISEVGGFTSYHNEN